MYTINPGEFKHSIIINTTVNSVDSDGIPAETGITLLETKAKILNISGKEFILADGISTNNSKRFYIRWKNINLTSKNKIIYNNKTYNITSVSDIEERHKYYEIVAELVE